jgi:ribose-phosphate pyrophosphokinase
MNRVLIALPGNEKLCHLLAPLLGADISPLDTRHFPDGETYVRLDPSVAGKQVIFVCTLDRPDDKFLRLVFSCAAARDLEAASVGLVAPYLAYMRQDKPFHPGEAVTAHHFASTLSPWIDWLVTVDPHLHRIHHLADVYDTRAAVAHAAPAVASWIGTNVPEPVLIGPDEESGQWVRDIAGRAGAPCIALTKQRLGDKEVKVTVPDLDKWSSRTPVIVDDIISTGQSMVETIQGIRNEFAQKPVCIGVHALFAGSALADLVAAGAGRIVSCNTIAHQTNAIDVSKLLAIKTEETLPSLS